MNVKLLALALVVAGLSIGLFLSYGTYHAMHITSDEKFCVSCHEMDPMVVAYKNDVHGGSGHLGANAKCVDCHLPHESLAGYIYTKARNGVVEGAVHFFGDLDAIDWYEKRKHRESYVFDSGCLECHGNIIKETSSSPFAQKMHAHYLELQNTNDEIKCVSCHIDAGHKDLRSVLNYYKPEFPIYEEKMEEIKKEVIEEYKKYGISDEHK